MKAHDVCFTLGAVALVAAVGFAVADFIVSEQTETFFWLMWMLVAGVAAVVFLALGVIFQLATWLRRRRP